MNINRGDRKNAEAEPTDGVGSGTLGRRSVLGGLAAVPVLSSLVGSATSASAATAAPHYICRPRAEDSHVFPPAPVPPG